MGNTNFQTIHQMGTAISDIVKQATGRDNVQNVVMDHVTVAQNHRYEEVDLSGQVVSFQAGEAGLTFEKMVVHIEPVQSGSGDPSPDNIRPITGWTMVNLYQAGYNMEDARVYRFTFPSEAGIVYGGTLDAVTGVLTVDRAEVDLGTLNWTRGQFAGITGYYTRAPLDIKPCVNTAAVSAILSNFSTIRFNAISITYGAIALRDNGTLYVNYADQPTGEMVYELATPISFHLSPQQIATLLGQNHIWADTGDIEVKFTNVKEMY